MPVPTTVSAGGSPLQRSQRQAAEDVHRQGPEGEPAWAVPATRGGGPGHGTPPRPAGRRGRRWSRWPGQPLTEGERRQAGDHAGQHAPPPARPAHRLCQAHDLDGQVENVVSPPQKPTPRASTHRGASRPASARRSKAPSTRHPTRFTVKCGAGSRPPRRGADGPAHAGAGPPAGGDESTAGRWSARRQCAAGHARPIATAGRGAAGWAGQAPGRRSASGRRPSRRSSGDAGGVVGRQEDRQAGDLGRLGRAPWGCWPSAVPAPRGRRRPLVERRQHHAGRCCWR